MHVRSAVAAGLVAAGFGLSAPLAFAAPITFAFPANGTPTPFSSSAGGITATFSASNDPSGFFVEPSAYRTIPGSVLADSGIGGGAFASLTISFSAPVQNVSFRFGLSTSGPGPLDLAAFAGGTMVGSTSATGTVPPTDVLAQGALSFGGVAFDRLVLSDTVDPGFAVGALTVSTTPIPEPAGLGVLGIGALGLVFAGGSSARRRRA